jgi:hypothetical protein
MYDQKRPKSRCKFRPRLTTLENRAVPSFGWAAGVGGEHIATDTAGDLYVTGSFTGSFTPAGSSTALNSAGGLDVFVAKYSRGGAFQWATRMGGASNEGGEAIALDTSGHAYVVSLEAGIVSLAKLDANTGGVEWSRNGFAGGLGEGVAVDSLGNAYVSAGGYYNQTLTKVAPDSSLVWQHTFNGYAEALSGGITVSGNHVYLTGEFVGTVDFDPGPGKANLRTGGTGGFVLKLTTGGTYVWARAFSPSGSGGYCVPDSIGVDSAGNVYTSGGFGGTVDFDPGKGKVSLNSANGAGYIVKLNSSGNYAWAKQLNVSLMGESSAYVPDFSSALTVDPSDSVYLTGGFSGTVDFNPGSGVFNLTSAGGSDIFVSKIDTNGNFQWAVRAGNTGDDFGNAIAVNSFGDIYVTGSIGGGTVDFDLTSSYFDNRDLLTGPGGFLWQILQPQ